MQGFNLKHAPWIQFKVFDRNGTLSNHHSVVILFICGRSCFCAAVCAAREHGQSNILTEATQTLLLIQSVKVAPVRWDCI